MLRFRIEPVTQLEEVRHLLADFGLPFTDIIPDVLLHFFGHRADSELVGIIGLELCGSAALLRSLAVMPQQRNNFLGKSLVDFA